LIKGVRKHPSPYCEFRAMFLDPEKPISKHRINLPHWRQEGTWVFVTWRQADSLPESAVSRTPAWKFNGYFMPQSLSRILIHTVYSTKDRLFFLRDPEFRDGKYVWD